MVKALKDTPQEDNRVLGDPYNRSPYIPRIPPHLPTFRRELRATPFFPQPPPTIPRVLKVERCLVVDSYTPRNHLG